MATVQQRLAADLAAVLNSADGPAVPVEIDGEPFFGIFDDSFKEIEQNGIVVWSDTPVLSVLPAVAEEVGVNQSIITIGEEDYQAYRKVPDGTGLVDLLLTRSF